MIEQLIAEATECDFKVALETKKPKSWLKRITALRSWRQPIWNEPVSALSHPIIFPLVWLIKMAS